MDNVYLIRSPTLFGVTFLESNFSIFIVRIKNVLSKDKLRNSLRQIHGLAFK